jgi:hypothetical protein
MTPSLALRYGAFDVGREGAVDNTLRANLRPPNDRIAGAGSLWPLRKYRAGPLNCTPADPKASVRFGMAANRRYRA